MIELIGCFFLGNMATGLVMVLMERRRARRARDLEFWRNLE